MATEHTTRRARGLYVRVYDSLPEHRKTLRAAGLLRVPVELLIGHLVRLWLWALHNADASGAITGGTCDELAMAARWAGSPKDFEAALAMVGFIEVRSDGFVIHDWEEQSGRVNSERERERERWYKRTRKDAEPDDTLLPPYSGLTPPEYGGDSGAHSDGDSTGVPMEPPPELPLKYSTVQLEAGGAASAQQTTPPAAHPVLTFPCQGKVREWGLSAEMLESLQSLYPQVEVKAELEKVAQKVRDGAITRKTAKGMARAIYTWLDNAVRWKSSPRSVSGDGPRESVMTEADRVQLEREEFGRHPLFARYVQALSSGLPPVGFEVWLERRPHG